MYTCSSIRAVAKEMEADGLLYLSFPASFWEEKIRLILKKKKLFNRSIKKNRAYQISENPERDVLLFAL